MEQVSHDVRYCIVKGAARDLGARLANATAEFVVLHADPSTPIRRLAPLLFEVRRALALDGIAFVLCDRRELLAVLTLAAQSGFNAEPPCLWHTPEGARWLVPLLRRDSTRTLALPVVARDEDEPARDAWSGLLGLVEGAPDEAEDDDARWLVELDGGDNSLAEAAFGHGRSWLGNGARRSPEFDESIGEDGATWTARSATVVPGILQVETRMAPPVELPELFPARPLAEPRSAGRPRRRGQPAGPRLPSLEPTGTD